MQILTLLLLPFIGYPRIKSERRKTFFAAVAIKLAFSVQKRLALHSILRSRRNILSLCTHRCSNTELYSWAAYSSAKRKRMLREGKAFGIKKRTGQIDLLAPFHPSKIDWRLSCNHAFSLLTINLDMLRSHLFPQIFSY